MNQSSSDNSDKSELRKKIIGLGDRSARKSYYPQLIQKISDLEAQSQELSQIVETLQKKEAALTRALEEREVLIQEIHHRVKNNFQLISSLLQLQTNKVENPLIEQELRESQNRIHIMSMVYEKLYQGQHLESVQFDEFLHDLAGKMVMLYGECTSGLQIDERLEPVTLDLNTCIPLALISTEAISNACKYAYRDRTEKRLSMELKQNGDSANGTCYLRISDNGPGLPADFNVHEAENLGLQLVYLLADQIGAKIEVDTGANGTSVAVHFQCKSAVE